MNHDYSTRIRETLDDCIVEWKFGGPSKALTDLSHLMLDFVEELVGQDESLKDFPKDWSSQRVKDEPYEAVHLAYLNGKNKMRAEIRTKAKELLEGK